MKISEKAPVRTVEEKKKVCTVPAADVARVKGLGCLWDKRTEDRFNVRVVTVNGKLSSEKLAAVAEAASRFGSGEAAMTTRLSVEIQGVSYDNIEPMREFLAQHGLQSGGTGPKVRPVVSCKGTTCQYGLIDTHGLAEKIHKLFYEGYHDVRLPHKFKIGVGGCPNNCVKPTLNDLGIVGQRVPVVDPEMCKGCKTCQLEKACPVHVAHVEDGKIMIDPEACKHCGRCVGKCPFHVADQCIDGYRVYLGGRWGKDFAHGKPMELLVTDERELLAIVEKAILLFRDQGVAGERFSSTIERIGFETACAMLEGNELLERKAEILSK